MIIKIPVEFKKIKINNNQKNLNNSNNYKNKNNLVQTNPSKYIPWNNFHKKNLSQINITRASINRSNKTQKIPYN